MKLTLMRSVLISVISYTFSFLTFYLVIHWLPSDFDGAFKLYATGVNAALVTIIVRETIKAADKENKSKNHPKVKPPE